MTVVGAALSEHPLATHAVGETVGHLLEVGGPRPDLVTLFATEPHLGALEDIVRAVRHLLEPRVLVGAASQSVLGGAREVEDHAALVVQAMWFGGARIRPVRIDTVPGADGPQLRGAGALEGTRGTLVLLTDPFSFPVDLALGDLAVTAPGLSVVGGAASAARRPGGNRLVLDAAIHDHGAVAALVDDTVPLMTAVSQGCRPIGPPFTVTRSERNRLHELAGRPALERLLEVVDGLDDTDRALAAEGLRIGRVVDEHLEEPGRGDFLVRRVLGGDREAGVVAIGDEIPVGATVRFQVRDAASAREDLVDALGGLTAAGALCFTDTARGSDFFGGPDQDALTVSEALDGAAVAGTFCSGTFGPVGGHPALHDAAMCVLLVDAAPAWP
ncbi:FIST signal transduction protein [Dermatobacter hominis]|uniref:FIST signal transduction protein n=1 Tax=Dermatobacter hominis TaxID=2884263 RepID=UPI001D10E887|nr:FIST N-terminal domain-containing protein [Dermatobacter hominis]UDY36412.1 FIST C-terminal domain-containing protein [Dermatobacter hominis]